MLHSMPQLHRPERGQRLLLWGSSSLKNLVVTDGRRPHHQGGFISTLMILLVFLACHDHHSVAAFATPQPGGTSAGVVFGRGGGGGGRSHEHSSTLSSSSSTTFLRSSTTSTSTSRTVISDANLNLLSERGRRAVLMLAEDEHQAHVVGMWPTAGTEDEGKRRLAEQLADLDAAYPGGLSNYLSKARALLAESAAGTNPFADYTAQIPDGETVSFPTTTDSSSSTLDELEAAGLDVASGAVFCLVAGGLGERLGFSGIKLSLSTNTCTDTCYLQFYADYINALQERVRERTGDASRTLPLVIMTSGDTDTATRELLRQHDNFGLAELHVVTQDKVPALKDGMAGLAMDDAWTVQTKPHGHGDVHHLLYKSGLVQQWVSSGKKSHVVFLQDTNALVVNSILPTLGVSAKNGFAMNSICIPRIAGEAAGAITRLEHKTDPDKSLVINVEYNQLDPLLRTQGAGDVADPDTGYSPFPGNANNLVIELGAYLKTLQGEDQGVVIEFVNPKYKDDTRTVFKKATRLECMMQDIPKLFQKELKQEAKIGFTSFDRWYTFSPAKNSLESGQDAVKAGNNAPGTLSSAESDLYVQYQRKLAQAGASLPTTEEMATVAGIPVTAGPRVILSPSFAITQKELRSKVQSLTLSSRSSLVLDGRHIVLKNLTLDGALVIRVLHKDAHVVVDGLSVQNQGWKFAECDIASAPETVQIRGYTMEKLETREYVIEKSGKYLIDASGELKSV